jgi:hypothetical protein
MPTCVAGRPNCRGGLWLNEQLMWVAGHVRNLEVFIHASCFMYSRRADERRKRRQREEAEDAADREAEAKEKRQRREAREAQPTPGASELRLLCCTRSLVMIGNTYHPVIGPEIVFIGCTAETANGYADAKSVGPAQSQPQQQQQEQTPPEQQQQQHVFDPADPIYQAMMAAAQAPAKPAAQVKLMFSPRLHPASGCCHAWPAALLLACDSIADNLAMR